MRRKILPVDEIVAAYLAGTSEKRVAAQYCVSRNVIRLRLLEAGVEPRGRSAAMRERMAQATPEQRRALAAAANEAARGRVPTEQERCRTAKTRERRQCGASRLEERLARWLEQRGVEPVRQKAVGRYNVDLACHPVAVEVFGGGWHLTGRHLARADARTRYLFDRGWHLYVVLVRQRCLVEDVADDLVAYIERARRDPSARREYRVVRGTGEPLAAGDADDDEITLKPTTRVRRDARGRYESVAG